MCSFEIFFGRILQWSQLCSRRGVLLRTVNGTSLPPPFPDFPSTRPPDPPPHYFGLPRVLGQ